MQNNIFCYNKMNKLLILAVTLIIFQCFALENTIVAQYDDDGVPVFDSVLTTQVKKRNPKASDSIPVQKSAIPSREGASPLSSGFTGGLFIHSDMGDTLPVFINNKRVGVTPYRVERCVVGMYSISYMDSSLRDKFLNDKGSVDLVIPNEYAFIFKNKNLSAPIVRKTLSEYAEQKVIVKSNEVCEVVFPIKDMLSALANDKHTYYGKIILGGAIITGLALVLIIANAN